MSTRDGFAALLLAGGASSRMGQPKALLDYAGQPLWRIQMEKLRALDPGEMFLSLPPVISLPPGSWQILHDEKSGLGPLSGLHAALKAMTGEWLVVLAIDLPDMTVAFLQHLCAMAMKRNCGIVPQLDGFYHGLVAVYPRAMVDLCKEHLASEDRSLQRFVRLGIAHELLAAYPMAETDRFLFRNVNSPEDL
jgi:molybdenum cofactor guanylyltransferase